MFKNRKVKHCLLFTAIFMSVFFILSPLEWSLIFKYSLKGETKVESLILDEHKVKLIEESKPLIGIEEDLSFFTKLDRKYYFLEIDTDTSHFCTGGECRKLQFYCRDDVCLSEPYEAVLYLIILAFSLFFPLIIYGCILIGEPKEVMS